MTHLEQNLSFQVQKSEHKIRLDVFLCAHTSLSRARVQALLRQGHVKLIRGGTAHASSASLAVRHGDELCLHIPPPQPSTLVPYSYPLDILYEDDELLVLDKPAGLVVHPAPGHPTQTLVHALLAHCGQSLSSIGGITRPGIVHRLDKDTSGVMVVAKTDTAHHGLAKQFQAHGRDGKLLRRYEALVWGKTRPPAATIDKALGRHPHHRQKQAVRAQGGRAAQTSYRTLAQWDIASGISLLECTLHTGRTHQIRVHCAHIGYPVLGDMLYGAGFISRIRAFSDHARQAYQALGRHALHASRLEFIHPATQKRLRFKSALPDDMQALMAALH